MLLSGGRKSEILWIEPTNPFKTINADKWKYYVYSWFIRNIETSYFVNRIIPRDVVTIIIEYTQLMFNETDFVNQNLYIIKAINQKMFGLTSNDRYSENIYYYKMHLNNTNYFGLSKVKQAIFYTYLKTIFTESFEYLGNKFPKEIHLSIQSKDPNIIIKNDYLYNLFNIQAMWGNIVRLELVNCNIDCKFMSYLITVFDKLKGRALGIKSLYFDNNKRLKDNGCIALIRYVFKHYIKLFWNLKYISFVNTGITDIFLDRYHDCTFMHLSYTQITLNLSYNKLSINQFRNGLAFERIIFKNNIKKINKKSSKKKRRNRKK
mmetsp:Transcript_91317/g.111796  ORF Transcript_91317/g.111796 Transcript_91317/m.111796 type:complete len:320 (+) Transcript_91317:76-1035(+)